MEDFLKLNIVIPVSLLFLSLLSCCSGEKRNPNWVENKAENNRIKGVADVLVGGYRYQIISVDGKEYISNMNGGMCPLEKQLK
ncbi:MAG: hypothetical protein AABY22_33225 [Nanoarchaeota archaeon]